MLRTQSVSIRRPDPQTNKGWEARFRTKNETEASQLSQLLLKAGISPGKAWRKGSGLVVPVYGEENVKYIQSHLHQSTQDIESAPKISPTPTVSQSNKIIAEAKLGAGDREVDQNELGEYLQQHNNGKIQIRYQSKRVNSARRWRELKLIDFDDTYIYTEDPESEWLIRYRRDGIVEYK